MVEKSRIADMNVLSPKRKFDWRISVNTEVPGESSSSRNQSQSHDADLLLHATPARTPPAHSTPTMSRNKDRISYSHQLFQIDLTQVTQGLGGPVMHELEIEFKDARVLLAEGRKEQEGQDNRYLEMVQAFLNNIREPLSLWRVSRNDSANLSGWRPRDAHSQRRRAMSSLPILAVENTSVCL